MRKIFFLVTVAAMVPWIVSAQPATINGRIEGYSGNPVYASYNRTIDTLRLDRTGAFTLKTNIPEERCDFTFFGIADFQVNLVAGKGQKVGFVVDLTSPANRTVTFTGDNSALNDYLTSYNIASGGSAWSLERIAGMGSFVAYKAAIDEMFAGLQAKLDKVDGAEEKAGLQENLNLARQSFYFRYAWAINRIGDLPVDSDGDFVRYAESIDMNDRRIIDEPRRQMTYSGLLDQRLRWEVERNPDKYTGKNSSQKYFAAISDLVSDPDVAGKLATNNFEMYLTLGADNNMLETFEAYKKIGNDPARIAVFQKKVNELDELSPGKMAPDFVLVDADGNKRMLSDLRGKNIYIDVWATWCGPCVMEIPFVEKLHEKYIDSKNLEFVSISVDDNVSAWKKKLEADKPGWSNYVVEGGFRGPMNQLYYISGIPRFMLIDKEGRIVSVNAPRPSSEGIDEYLAPYL